MVSSLQFCGNIEEYFSQHCEKLVAFIVMPRLKNKGNLLRVYKHRELALEQKARDAEKARIEKLYRDYPDTANIILSLEKSQEENARIRDMCRGFVSQVDTMPWP